jgi:hypothetical protein
MHVRAFAEIRELERLTVFSTTPARREAFAAAAAAELKVPADAVADPQAAVKRADVVLAAARSHGEAPILFADWLARAPRSCRSAPPCRRSARSTSRWLRPVVAEVLLRRALAAGLATPLPIQFEKKR